MATKGWIKLHRKSTENPLYFAEPFDKWHAWTDILLMVNHEKKQFISKGQVIVLEPGQTVTSLSILADRWRWSINKVRRYLGTLNGMGMCNINSTANGTAITVVNWAFYQNQWHSDEYGNEYADEYADEQLTRRKRSKW